ncbi:hypothetical protein BEH94_06560 [Candidatus Altiarchaeales archaeon WOR_SM1_SCG]|nr:hypothetical protein BEH94_06560 [Candidatus Altiarchaeales archaeon WOR_SM1_SCG]
MVKLILYTGTNCPKCPAAHEIVEEVANELGLVYDRDYVVKNIDEEEVMIEALQYQIASTPAIVINDEAVFIAEVPTKEELLDKLKN